MLRKQIELIQHKDDGDVTAGTGLEEREEEGETVCEGGL